MSATPTTVGAPKPLSALPHHDPLVAYLMDVLHSVDNLGETIFGGPVDLSISAELANKKRNIVERLSAHALIAALDAIDPHHVEGAALADELRAKVAEKRAAQDAALAAQKGI